MNGPGKFGAAPRALRRVVNQIPQEVEPASYGRDWQSPPPRRAALEPDCPVRARLVGYGWLAFAVFLMFVAMEMA